MVYALCAAIILTNLTWAGLFFQTLERRDTREELLLERIRRPEVNPNVPKTQSEGVQAYAPKDEIAAIGQVIPLAEPAETE